MPNGQEVAKLGSGPQGARSSARDCQYGAAYRHEDRTPWWVPIPTLGIALAILSMAIMQRAHAGHDLGGPVLFATAASLPWVYDVVAVLRGWRPVLPLWVFPVLPLVGTALLLMEPVDVDPAPMLLVLLAGELAFRDISAWRLVAIGTGAASIGLLIVLEGLEVFVGAYLFMIGVGFGWCSGWIGGILVRKNAELEDAQAELAEKAASDERQRIAREVHDVIAHSLSVTMLHLSAARMATERGRSEDALEALREAERHGRSSLTDIRRTVGLLSTDETTTAPPAPSATDLPTLVGDFRTAGLDVALEVSGELALLPPAAGLDLYRIVQESLTNVAKHAPGAKATVEIDLTTDEIRMSIRNSAGNGFPAAKPAGNGLGLRGMAERAASLGGTLRTENRDGWTVSLVAPRPYA